MALVAKETGGNFIPAPAGVHQAVCVDVIDLGVVESAFYKRSAHKCYVVWEIDETMPDGKRFTARRRYTVSLNSKATMRKDLESWRGRIFTPEELQGFDVEVVIGANCTLSIVHETREGDTYANVQAIMPRHKTLPKISPSGKYVRMKDRKPEDAKQGAGTDEYVPTDEDVPF
jgi:hypothetical protein